jgi:hypothetical protein
MKAGSVLPIPATQLLPDRTVNNAPTSAWREGFRSDKANYCSKYSVVKDHDGWQRIIWDILCRSFRMQWRNEWLRGQCGCAATSKEIERNSAQRLLEIIIPGHGNLSIRTFGFQNSNNLRSGLPVRQPNCSSPLSQLMFRDNYSPASLSRKSLCFCVWGLGAFAAS